jgi:hypothetical protein
VLLALTKYNSHGDESFVSTASDGSYFSAASGPAAAEPAGLEEDVPELAATAAAAVAKAAAPAVTAAAAAAAADDSSVATEAPAAQHEDEAAAGDALAAAAAAVSPAAAVVAAANTRFPVAPAAAAAAPAAAAAAPAADQDLPDLSFSVKQQQQFYDTLDGVSLVFTTCSLGLAATLCALCFEHPGLGWAGIVLLGFIIAAAVAVGALILARNHWLVVALRYCWSVAALQRDGGLGFNGIKNRVLRFMLSWLSSGVLSVVGFVVAFYLTACYVVSNASRAWSGCWLGCLQKPTWATSQTGQGKLLQQPWQHLTISCRQPAGNLEQQLSTATVSCKSSCNRLLQVFCATLSCKLTPSCQH